MEKEELRQNKARGGKIAKTRNTAPKLEQMKQLLLEDTPKKTTLTNATCVPSVARAEAPWRYRDSGFPHVKTAAQQCLQSFSFSLRNFSLF